jgi:hypothetical protein
LHSFKFTFNTHISRPFFTIKTRWSRFSIPNFECQRLMMTLATLKMHSVSIYEPIIPSIWWTKKTMCGYWIVCWLRQAKGFSIYDYVTHNRQNNYRSFFKVDLITSSFDIICPLKKSSSSIVVPSTNTLVRFR